MSEPLATRFAGAGSALHVFTPAGCSELVAEHARLFPAPDAGCVVGHLVAPGADVDAALRSSADAFAMWDALREQTGQASRYSNAQSFLRRASSARSDGEGAQPLAVLLVHEGAPQALFCGFYARRAKPRGAKQQGLRQLARLAPALRGWRMPELATVVAPGPEAAELARTYLAALLERGIVQRLELENIACESALHAALASPGALPGALARLDKVRWKRRMIDAQSGEVIEHNSSKTRHGIRRKQKQLAKRFESGLDYTRVSAPEDVDAFVTRAARIVRQTYQASLGIGAVDTPAYKAFCREVAEAGHLRGYLFEGDGEPIAYVLGDTEGGEYHLWATSFVPEYGKHSPGMVLVRLAIDDLQAEGIPMLDFGDGEAQYKEMFGSECVAEQDFCAYGPGPAARLGHGVDRGSTWLVETARRLLERRGLMDRARSALR